MSAHMEFRVIFPEFCQPCGLFSKAFYMFMVELIKLGLLPFCSRVSILGFRALLYLFLLKVTKKKVLVASSVENNGIYFPVRTF